MKIKLLRKLVLLFVSFAMLSSLDTKAESSGRKVDKAFYEEMKIVDPTYVKSIKKDEKGNLIDYNQAGLSDQLKMKFENREVKLSNDQLRMPANDKEKQTVLVAYPTRIQYLQSEIDKMKNSVDIYNTKLEIKRMQVILDKVKNNKQ
jgi:hypothetical protein